MSFGGVARNDTWDRNCPEFDELITNFFGELSNPKWERRFDSWQLRPSTAFSPPSSRDEWVEAEMGLKFNLDSFLEWLGESLKAHTIFPSGHTRQSGVLPRQLPQYVVFLQ